MNSFTIPTWGLRLPLELLSCFYHICLEPFEAVIERQRPWCMSPASHYHYSEGYHKGQGMTASTCLDYACFSGLQPSKCKMSLEFLNYWRYNNTCYSTIVIEGISSKKQTRSGYFFPEFREKLEESLMLSAPHIITKNNDVVVPIATVAYTPTS